MVRLLFIDRRDLPVVWGHTRIEATPLRRMSDHGSPPFLMALAIESADGRWDVLGYQCGKRTPWQLWRASTADGSTFDEVRVVLDSDDYTLPDGTYWQHVATVSYSPEQERFLCLKNAEVPEGFATYAFFSRDGESWEEAPKRPVYTEGDRWGAIWSSPAARFITYNKGWLRCEGKRVNELFLDAHRTVCIRSSPDALTWSPSAPNAYKLGMRWARGMRKVGGPLVPREFHVAPDADDPPDLEFYASWPFTYAGRYFLNVLTYCGSFLPNGLPPMRPDGHGPGTLGHELWVSDDGLTWERPFRGQDVGTSIMAGPIQASGKLLFYNGDQVWGVPEDRLTNVSARSNGLFETRTFTVPARPLRLNLQLPGDGFTNYNNESYLMAELVDDRDRVIAGYDRNACLLQGPIDATRLVLRWQGATSEPLAGRRARLRVCFRGARIFAVTA
jgi:hypothetical protein